MEGNFIALYKCSTAKINVVEIISLVKFFNFLLILSQNLNFRHHKIPITMKIVYIFTIYNKIK
jgi:hypothetical protein